MQITDTKRLFLREMKPDDFQALFLVLGDPETMRHYPYTFDEQHVRDWIERNRKRYRENGFGLWAVCLKETGEMIGDCGLTLQNINGELLPEIGYHIRRDCQPRGRPGYPCLECGANRRLPGNRSHAGAFRGSSQIHRMGTSGAGTEAEEVRQVIRSIQI